MTRRCWLSLLQESAERAMNKLPRRTSGLMQKASVAHAYYLPDFLRTKPEPIPCFGCGLGEAADMLCEEDGPDGTSPEAGCSLHRDQGRQNHRLSAKSHKHNISGVFHCSLAHHTFPPTQCQFRKLNINGVRVLSAPSGASAAAGMLTVPAAETPISALQGHPLP